MPLRDAVVVATAWTSVIGSAVTAIAAFGGVLLAQRATRMRDLEGRIWERRSWVYEDLMRWGLVIDHAVDDSGSRPSQNSLIGALAQAHVTGMLFGHIGGYRVRLRDQWCGLGQMHARLSRHGEHPGVSVITADGRNGLACRQLLLTVIGGALRRGAPGLRPEFGHLTSLAESPSSWPGALSSAKAGFRH